MNTYKGPSRQRRTVPLAIIIVTSCRVQSPPGAMGQMISGSTSRLVTQLMLVVVMVWDESNIT